MELVKILTFQDEDFDKIWGIYESSFPEDERRSRSQQKILFDNERYSFFGAYDSGSVVGLISYWDLKDFSFIEHLAISDSRRGGGLGSSVLEKFVSDYGKSQNGEGSLLVLEVDRPKDKESIRRVEFYTGNGFVLNPVFNYYQPPLGEGKNAVPMFLMTSPKEIEDNGQYAMIEKRIHTVAYGLDEPLIFDPERR